MTAQENYQAALRHVSKLKELTENDLEELQDFIYTELARGREYAYDNWYNDPAMRKGGNITEDIDNMLNDPSFIRLLPSYYFESEELLKAVQMRLKPQKQRAVNQSLRFVDLFQRPEDATKVKEIFEQSKITSHGVYKVNPRRSNNRSELLAAYYSLRPIMRQHSKTAGARCFYGEFNAVVDMHDRMLTQEPYNTDRAKFDKLFASLLTK